MNLAELLRWTESIVPEADETVIPSISTTQLSKRDILNQGEYEFVRLTKCFPTDNKFNCTANTREYPLRTNVPNYLEPRPEGLWHFRSDTSTNIWERVRPTTIRRLDQRMRTWRTQGKSDLTQEYWIDGDKIGVFYTPSTTIVTGFWFYYFATSSQMSSLTDYPFTGSQASSRLEPYHKHLLVYYEYRALGILGYKQDAVAKEKEFYQLCMQAKAEQDSRQDIVQETQVRPQIQRSPWRR